MTRPPLMSAEKKTLIVVSILRGEVTMADAARREGVSQTTIAKWRDRFLAGGQTALAAGNHHGSSSCEIRLTAEVEELTPSTINTATSTLDRSRPNSSASAARVPDTNRRDTELFDSPDADSVISRPIGSFARRYLRAETPASIRSVATWVNRSCDDATTNDSSCGSGEPSAAATRGRRIGTLRHPTPPTSPLSHPGCGPGPGPWRLVGRTTLSVPLPSSRRAPLNPPSPTTPTGPHGQPRRCQPTPTPPHQADGANLYFRHGRRHRSSHRIHSVPWWSLSSRDCFEPTRYLPHGRHQAGDHHPHNINSTRDNLTG